MCAYDALGIPRPVFAKRERERPAVLRPIYRFGSSPPREASQHAGVARLPASVVASPVKASRRGIAYAGAPPPSPLYRNIAVCLKSDGSSPCVLCCSSQTFAYAVGVALGVALGSVSEPRSSRSSSAVCRRRPRQRRTVAGSRCAVHDSSNFCRGHGKPHRYVRHEKLRDHAKTGCCSCSLLASPAISTRVSRHHLDVHRTWPASSAVWEAT